MSLKFPLRRLRLAAIMAGVTVLVTPVIFYPANIQEITRDGNGWLSSRVGQSIGPPGGDIRALCTAPSDPRRLYAGTVNGHIFVSIDGAGSWEDCQLDIIRDAVISKIAVDPRSPDVAYAAYWLHFGGGGVLKSEDGGKSWKEMAVQGRPALRAIAISPSEPDTIFAGGPEGLWRSPDAGENWSKTGGRARQPREVDSIAINPTDPDVIYAGTWQQAYRSDDGGVTWTRIGRGMDTDRDIFTIVQSPKDPRRLYAGTCGYLYSSSDSGDLWAEHKRGIPSDHRRVHSIAVDPLRPEEIWVGTRGGVYRSLDGASSFDQVYGCVSVSAIATDNTGVEVIAGTEELGVVKSAGGGAFQESNLGLGASKVAAFDTMPGNLQVIFAARTDAPDYQSIQVSSDGGSTWTRLGGQLFEKVRFIRAVDDLSPGALVIQESGRWWSLSLDGVSRALIQPPGRLAAVEIIHELGSVIAATDSGLFYAKLADLEPKPAQIKKPPQVKQAGARTRKKGAPRVKTATRAETGHWKLIRSGRISALAVAGNSMMALGLDRVVSGSVSAILDGMPASEASAAGLPDGVLSAAIPPDGGPFACAATVAQVLVSFDRGRSWKQAKLPWPAPEIRAIAIDPDRPERAVALDYRGAVFIGGDGDKRWRAGGDDTRLHQAHDLRMSPLSPGFAIVATIGHGLRVISLDRFDYDPFNPPPAICPETVPEYGLIPP